MEDKGVNLTTDTSGEISDSVHGIFDWIADTANWLRSVVIGIVVVIIAIVAYFLYVHIKKNGGSQSSSSSPSTFSMGKTLLKNPELIPLLV